MRITSIFMPFFALLAGAAGFCMRLTERWNVFDAAGLPERGASITLVLIAFSAVFLLIALLFAIRAGVKYRSPSGFENAFGTDPLTYPFVFSLIGIVWLGATVKYFFDLNSAGGASIGELCFVILSALSAISTAFFAIEMYQDPRRKMVFTLTVVPTLFLCFWLILMYKQNAANPVLLSYCYQCLAIIAAALGCYYTSGFVYRKPYHGKAIFAYMAAIYFCFVTIADKQPMTTRLIYAAIIAVNLIYLSMLIRNLRRKDLAVEGTQTASS